MMLATMLQAAQEGFRSHNEFVRFWYHHQVICTMAAYIVFSNAVGALPTPSTDSGMGYRWFFGFMHGLAANLSRIREVRALADKLKPEPKADA